ncbi:hypothetical protein PpBr36_08248 [Pyricularia pennisetigena]|uniref:hypothetical protein n=1 Tax=Pyricularia pennisetigena TaxID=1578925 RepID=UPI00114D73AB|nr:hypothetical protein PpBr36_08248 [Pyricularia pennisetigena]TLS23930.1 hypothetical protein PpBr36_08248 [Pyricularia pennisetigena]
MLLSTLPLRRYAPRLGFLVDSSEYLRVNARRPVPWFHASRLLATAAASPVDGTRTFQSSPPVAPNWHDDNASTNSVSKNSFSWSWDPKYFKHWGPSYVLRQWLTKGYGFSEHHDHLQRSAAASWSTRLSIVALQVDMMRAELAQPTGLSDHLITEQLLFQKLEFLASKGITMEDIDLWLWILRPENPVEMVHRLCSADRPVPPFVILQVLDFQQAYNDPEMLSRLYACISRAVCGEGFPQFSTPEAPNCESKPSEATSVSQLDKASPQYRYRWPPSLFIRLLSRMTHHSLHIWPASLPSLARLAERYIETMTAPQRSGIFPELVVRKRQNYVHNAALVIFSHHARYMPLANLKYNWEAQKVMLALSTKLARPPLIDQAGFRALRSVLGGLRKSKSERLVASRLSKSWPPYRQAWDGLDEKRPVEADYSRSVKAGILAREAGYAPDDADLAVDIIGGAALGRLPFIHYRTTMPQIGRMDASSAVIMPWAASIKATRNAQEAWQAFLQPPQPGVSPCAIVYNEMFIKLYAREVAKPDALPGTGPEVHPVHEVNLSEFEKARLQPPRPSELYEQMRNQGIRPVGHCLQVLLKNATSLKQITRYLMDSRQDVQASRVFVKLIDQRFKTDQPYESDEVKHLLNMPLHVFRASAIGVTRSLPYSWVHEGLKRKNPDIHRMENLINMTTIRMAHEKSPNMSVWHVIFDALARPAIAVLPHPGGLSPEAYETENRIHALRMFMRVFRHVRETTGIVDILMFDKLCLILRRAITAIKFQRGRSKYFDEVIDDAHAALKGAAAKLSQRIVTNENQQSQFLKLPSYGYRLGPVQVRSYFRTLAYLGDHDELLNRLEWIISEGFGDDGQEELLDTARDPDHPDHERLYISLLLFKAYMSKHVPPEMMEALKSRVIKVSEEKGLTWCWPDDEDVESFLDAERYRGDEAAFWEVAQQQERT